MDWAKAIETNHAALTRIVAALVAMVGLVEGGAAALLPRPLYLAVALMLRPAESAVRRLIVIAARGLVVKASASRPMVKGLSIARKGKGSERVSFPLFDAPRRVHVVRQKFTKLQPRIHVFPAPPPLSPLFYREPEFVPLTKPGPRPKSMRGVSAAVSPR